MNRLHRAAFVLTMVGLLLIVAPLNAQGDDAALWRDSYAATFGGQPLDYQLDAQADIDGLRTFVGGLQLKAQGQLDLSGKSPALSSDISGNV